MTYLPFRDMARRSRVLVERDSKSRLSVPPHLLLLGRMQDRKPCPHSPPDHEAPPKHPKTPQKIKLPVEYYGSKIPTVLDDVDVSSTHVIWI